uniref:HEJ1 n=1 Tax=Homo sapiens TaxID=9606 RepID=Q96RF1_HUMAN|nr:HEJ1 [Homo sapiens]
MQSKRKCKSVVHQLSVTLEDLYDAATRKQALQNNVLCDRCEDRGGEKKKEQYSAVIIAKVLECK